MIRDDPAENWIWIRPSKPKPTERGQQALQEYFEHYGKWLIFSRERPYLDELARKLDAYVERSEIDSVKYNREPSPQYKDLVMCVYCDDRERERIWGILQGLGIRRRIWKYDHQTFEDWRPGGRLYEKAKEVGRDKIRRTVKSPLKRKAFNGKQKRYVYRLK